MAPAGAGSEGAGPARFVRCALGDACDLRQLGVELVSCQLLANFRQNVARSRLYRHRCLQENTLLKSHNPVGTQLVLLLKSHNPVG